MIPILSLLLAFIFSTLALLHIYWAFGGHWGGAAAVPTKPDGSSLFQPGPVACLVVALGLFLFGGLVLAGGGWLEWGFSKQLLQMLIGGIALIFLARAIGDFRYVGFFKQEKGSLFARQDSKFYSPLCLFIALALTAIAWQL